MSLLPAILQPDDGRLDRDNQIAGGEAVVVFYDFPLTSIHPQAYAAARAARCAKRTRRISFWDMHDQLFETLGQWSVSLIHPVHSSTMPSRSVWTPRRSRRAMRVMLIRPKWF